MSMELAVLGTITRDTLVYPGERVTESLGGILYNVIALAQLTEYTITPIANVGRDVFDEVVSILSKYSNVVLSGLKKVEQKNNHCQLCFFSEYPAEVLSGRVPPISFKQVKPFLRKSLILVNFTSGFDLGLRTLRLIKERATCPIYLDYHLLVLGIDSIGNRFLKRRRNWLDWMSQADIVQLNRFEAEHVWQKKINSKEDALSFGKVVLNKGPLAIVITLGADGSMVVYNDGTRIECEYIEAERVPEVIDAIGCGDVYSAGFISHYLQFNDVVLACKFASFVASRKCSVSGLDNLEQILDGYSM